MHSYYTPIIVDLAGPKTALFHQDIMQVAARIAGKADEALVAHHRGVGGEGEGEPGAGQQPGERLLGREGAGDPRALEAGQVARREEQLEPGLAGQRQA